MTETSNSFPANALTAFPVFYRTYSRRVEGERETWMQVCDRTIDGLVELGKLTEDEARLCREQQEQLKALPSGRWLWVGGTEWSKKPENFPGSYNCSSTTVDSIHAMALMMDLAMQGCGTGAILESRYTSKIPPVVNHLNVQVVGEPGDVPKDLRVDETLTTISDDAKTFWIVVGDSRQGWVKAYQDLLELAVHDFASGNRLNVVVDLGNVRPSGEKLKGFGGTANPIKLKGLFTRCAEILNKAVGRNLTPLECCKLIDEAALVVVAGNVRRSAGIRQFDSFDTEAAAAKDNLWIEQDGQWKIDPERDCLRMANHTRVFHEKPTLEECIAAVRKQFYSGEGAIQWAGEAKRRTGDDIYGLNPCAEILLGDNFCNLAEIHLNQIDPNDVEGQEAAFTAGALAVAALLHHEFVEPRYQKSRMTDPIVGVSFTGLFDFFVNAFGVDWLRWWEAGRPDTMQGLAFKQKEQEYLTRWKEIVHRVVWDYCDHHGLKRPNRCTTVQPAGTKSLLTGASPGWHPPKAQRFLRRITFGKGDPVAMACLDYGYSVVPSQSDKDETGNLLNDPFDPRCTEWLVEIPVEVPWANLPGADEIAIEKFTAAAQFDFYMQVQKHYTTHNCFARSTPFLTDKGVRTFEDFEVGETVIVLNSDGDWVPAEVVNTGEKRPMLTITIQEGKSGKQKTITSTYCHRFPVRRISGGDSKVKIVKAEDLKIGHRLVLNAADLPDMDEDGIRHGIVFGDGSLYKNSKGEYHAAQLYLCGGKRHLQSYFTTFERTYERDDLDQTRIYGMPPEWKYLPSADCSQGYLAGFVAGLLATDGNISRSTISISTGRQNVVDFLINQCPRIGIKINGCKWFESNTYKEAGGAFQIRVSKATFPENMILRPHHMEHYRAHESQPCQWRVIDIEEAPEQVGWCVMEPITNHFTLTDNILVMNTSATIEFRESEIEWLGERIYQAIQNDEGYISAALLARFDDLQTFPRLPFEPIDKATYEAQRQQVEARRGTADFHSALARYDAGELVEAGPAGCDSDKCLMPEKKPQVKTEV